MKKRIQPDLDAYVSPEPEDLLLIESAMTVIRIHLGDLPEPVLEDIEYRCLHSYFSQKQEKEEGIPTHIPLVNTRKALEMFLNLFKRIERKQIKARRDLISIKENLEKLHECINLLLANAHLYEFLCQLSAYFPGAGLFDSRDIVELGINMIKGELGEINAAEATEGRKKFMGSPTYIREPPMFAWQDRFSNKSFCSELSETVSEIEAFLPILPKSGQWKPINPEKRLILMLSQHYRDQAGREPKEGITHIGPRDGRPDIYKGPFYDFIYDVF